MNVYAAVREYRGLTKKRREELASAIAEELAPRLHDNAGVHAFAIRDNEGTLTSTAIFQDKEAAELASKRPPVAEELSAESTVKEVPTRPRKERSESVTG